jgi:hypothetical protein
MAAVEKIIDVEQRREFRRVVAGVVATVYTDLQLPIAKRFPDLSTDEGDIRKTRWDAVTIVTQARQFILGSPKCHAHHCCQSAKISIGSPQFSTSRQQGGREQGYIHSPTAAILKMLALYQSKCFVNGRNHRLL